MTTVVFTLALGAIGAEAQPGESVIEEIIVTAQHREQNVQDVPISISAFGDADIQKNMFRDVTDFVGRTPNASFISNGARSRKEISMRGVTNFVNSNQARRTSTFGFYIDGFNLSSSSSNPPILDVERIEILRGPQSTYFGANALGGGISVTSKKPNSEEFEGSVMLDYGRFDTLDVEGTLNIPIIKDKLAARINYKNFSTDGNIENINPIGGGNDADYQYIKASVRYTPTDNLAIRFQYADSDELVGMREGVPSGVFSTFAGGTLFAGFPDRDGDGQADPDPDGVGFFPENDNRVNFNTPQQVGTEFEYLIVRVDYNFSNMAFASITGHVDSDFFLRGDIDGGSGDFFNEFRTIPRESFTQEFRLQSSGEERLSWNIGLYYSDDQGFFDSRTRVGAKMPFGRPEGFLISSTDSRDISEGWAIFGQADYSLNEAFTLSLGGRYAEETIETVVSTFTGAFAREVSEKNSFNDFSPKLAVSYDLNDTSRLYGSVAKGFKSGGVQLSPLPGAESYNPEEIWNYEIGYKAGFLDRTLRINAAIFYLDWTDLQTAFQQAGLDANGDFILFSGIDNAESATSKGVELSVTSVPRDDLVLNVNVGYLDATYEDFTAFIDGKNRVLDGKTIPNSPEWTLSADAEYSFALTRELEGFIRGEYVYRHGIRSTTSALIQSGFPWEVPSYNVVNLRAGISNDHYSLTLYLENAFDEEYFTNAYQKAFAGGLHIEPGVQRFGLRARYNF